MFWWQWKAKAEREEREKKIALGALQRNQEAMSARVQTLEHQLKTAEVTRLVLQEENCRSKRVEMGRRAGLSEEALRGGLAQCPGSEQWAAVNEVIDQVFVEETDRLLGIEAGAEAIWRQQGIAAGVLLVKGTLEEEIGKVRVAPGGQ